jgi:hypothetical protein
VGGGRTVHVSGGTQTTGTRMGGTYYGPLTTSVGGGGGRSNPPPSSYPQHGVIGHVGGTYAQPPTVVGGGQPQSFQPQILPSGARVYTAPPGSFVPYIPGPGGDMNNVTYYNM